MTTQLVLLVLIPLVTALGLAVVGPRSRDGAAAVALAASLAAVWMAVELARATLDGAVIRIGWPWLPLEGADLGLRLDGLATLFVLLITVFGALIVIYARYYLDAREPGSRFFARFLFFMGSMLGVVLADNLLLLTVFWELTSLASFLLIAFWNHRADARRGARLALGITALGGLALMAGVLLLGQIAGSLKLDVVLLAGDQVRAHPYYPIVLGLILVAVFTKSAQVPFHFWLPDAMAAPTPVSAYLHSVTLVKAGIFLLARLHPVLAGTEEWFLAVSGTGLITLLVAAYLAVFQHDLKGLLAYSTISHLGLITLLFGLNSSLGAVAALFHTMNHATFKASLFMAAGIIEHETGSRDMRRMGGLWSRMPFTAVLAITSSLAMAGVPLLNGFLSKEMFFAETLNLDTHPKLQVLIPALATLASAFAVAYSARFVHDVFWNGPPGALPREPHEAPSWMLLPVAVLSAACLLVGLLPEAMVGPLLRAAAGATLGTAALPDYRLAIWHGVSMPLVMSLVAMALGLLFYVYLQRLFRLHDRVHLPRGGRDVYAWILAQLRRFARALTTAIVNGRTQYSLAWIVLTALAAGAAALGMTGPLTGDAPSLAVNPVLAGVFGLAMVATVAVLRVYPQRVLAVVLSGAAGLSVALIFALLSAPDLALTQLLVEVAAVVLLLLALRYLPTEAREHPRSPHRGLRLGIAVGSGLGVALLCLAVLTRPQRSISDFFLENALPGAAGSNAVNVIIVDFRGLDTLGEITVLVIAGIIVGTVLAGLKAPAARLTGGHLVSLMLQQVVYLLLPLGALMSLYLFLRGHNEPGGGFIAGLVATLTLLLPFLARGAGWAIEHLPLSFWRVMGAGIGIAGLTGLGSFLFGHPFLTSTKVAPALPVIGKVPLPSAMFFDLGVLLAVVGAVLLALITLARIQPTEEQP